MVPGDGPRDSPQSTVHIPLWLQGDWGDFAGDRVVLQQLVAGIRDNEGASSVPREHRQRWSGYQRRVSVRNQRLPDGLVPLIDAIEKLLLEMPAYRKKVRAAEWHTRDTADARFLQGDWEVKELAPHAAAILQSTCVLSGGQALQAGLQQFLRDKRRRSKSRSKEVHRQRDAEQRQRLAIDPRLPGTTRARLPDSLRVLYGDAEKTEGRLFDFLDRAAIADRYLQSFRFQHCEYCKVGWFGSPLEKPNSCKLAAVDNWNMLLAPSSEWLEPGKRICRNCWQEAGRSAKAGGERCPRLFCAANDMDIGDTFPELDALTFFEEEILAPIQPMVRVYTLYATGMTELRGHVINVAQGGPQFVREIPARAKELNILLVRRFPRDPNRKQRVPFLADPARLEAALARLEGRMGSDEHCGLKYHRVVINRENLADYRDGEPDGLQVHEVDQRERVIFDRKLFGQWMGLDGCLQVNVLLRAHLDKVVVPGGHVEESDVESEDDAEGNDQKLAQMWCVVRRAVAEHMQAPKDAGMEGGMGTEGGGEVSGRGAGRGGG